MVSPSAAMPSRRRAGPGRGRPAQHREALRQRPVRRKGAIVRERVRRGPCTTVSRRRVLRGAPAEGPDYNRAFGLTTCRHPRDPSPRLPPLPRRAPASYEAGARGTRTAGRRHRVRPAAARPAARAATSAAPNCSTFCRGTPRGRRRRRSRCSTTAQLRPWIEHHEGGRFRSPGRAPAWRRVEQALTRWVPARRAGRARRGDALRRARRRQAPAAAAGAGGGEAVARPSARATMRRCARPARSS